MLLKLEDFFINKRQTIESKITNIKLNDKEIQINEDILEIDIKQLIH